MDQTVRGWALDAAVRCPHAHPPSALGPVAARASIQQPRCCACVPSARRSPPASECGDGADLCLRDDLCAAPWPRDEACAVFETGRVQGMSVAVADSPGPYERRQRPQKRSRSCLKSSPGEVCAGQAKKRVSWNRERFLEVRLFCTSDCPAHEAFMEFSNSDDDSDDSDCSYEGEEDVYELPAEAGLGWDTDGAEEEQWCDLEIDAAALLARLSYAHEFGCSVEV